MFSAKPDLCSFISSIIFSFKKKIEDFLDTISFGIFAVVHPSNYNPKSGEWLDDQNIVSSGFYQLETWTKDYLVLKLRPNYLRSMGNENKFDKIKISWDQDITDFDIYYGMSNEYKQTNKLKFISGMNSQIAYAHCLSWKDPKSPLFSRKVRAAIRDKIYSIMNSTEVTRSFFPLEIGGISEIQSTSPIEEHINFEKKIRIPKVSSSRKISQEFYKNLSHAISNDKHKLTEHEMELKDFIEQLNPKANHKIDLAAVATGILIDEPLGDIKFMFLSKEGIRLPDSTGEIKEELSNPNIDLQKINQLLWDQAIIWPLSHFSAGYWVKNEIDTSLLNTTLPPIDFAWIGSK